jgi:DNA replication and repair protein RecF
LVWLRVLALKDVRNIEDERVELGPGLNVFLGRNAQGKTSLLEGVGLLARGRSFRTDDLGGVVRRGARGLRVEGVASDSDRDVALGFGWAPEGRGYFVEGRPARPRDYQGRLEAAVYSTGRLRVVHGTMRDRRAYLDRAAAAISAGYRQVLRDYERVLRQRDAALEARSSDLPAWDERLVTTGAALRARRGAYVARLDAALQEAFRPAGERYGVAVEPPADEATETKSLERDLADELAKMAARERAAGRTLVGPHRDPVRLLVDGCDAATHASSGQVRSLLLALTLAGLAVYREQTGKAAVALLDDLDSELDAERAADVCRAVGERGQALVTSAHPEWVALLGEQARRFRVSGGRVAVFGRTA